MKHLVLHFSKSKLHPETRTFEDEDDRDKFIQQKLAAGITCYEYLFSNKYSVEPTVIKSATL